MGWTYTNRGSQSTKEFFESEFNYVRDNGMSGTIIRYSATWRVAYMAYEIKTPATETEAAKREVIAIVCLIHHVPNARDGYTFGYKDMTENMGPNESRCPKTILELLTPTTSEYALDWRERCWKRIKDKASKPKVKAGDWIKFSQKIPFVDGAELDTLKWLTGIRFSLGGNYTSYRISNWREREYANLGPDFKP